MQVMVLTYEQHSGMFNKRIKMITFLHSIN